jgi:hypothetical protein
VDHPLTAQIADRMAKNQRLLPTFKVVARPLLKSRATMLGTGKAGEDRIRNRAGD